MNEYTRPEFTRSALLTIDAQCDFTLPDAPAVVPRTFDVVPNMRRLALAYRQRKLPIVHIVRLYLPDGSNVDACRRSLIESGVRIVSPDSEGAELMASLKPSPEIRLNSAELLNGQLQPFGEHEWALYKSRWGAFYKTCLEDHLRALRVSTIVVTGCNFPNCPRATIYEASERDFRVALVEDAVSGLYDRGLEELRRIGVSLLSTNDLISVILEG
jgi:nicotinamidase-related amidase